MNSKYPSKITSHVCELLAEPVLYIIKNHKTFESDYLNVDVKSQGNLDDSFSSRVHLAWSVSHLLNQILN